jgi:hypothetical protein
MKRLNKILINPNNFLKCEELIDLKGGIEDPGYPSYRCYSTLGWFGHCSNFLGYINTASCPMAYDICGELWGGDCVEGGDCSPY